jgi:hypothetical protein
MCGNLISVSERFAVEGRQARFERALQLDAARAGASRYLQA